MHAISLDSADALLFDLGGVVIEIDFNRAFARWAAHSNHHLDTIKAKFSFDCFYQRHERGEIDASEYFASRVSLGIDISDPQFVDGWNAIYVREVPGVAALLQRAKGKMPLYAFTNSTPPSAGVVEAICRRPEPLSHCLRVLGTRHTQAGAWGVSRSGESHWGQVTADRVFRRLPGKCGGGTRRWPARRPRQIARRY
jgi:hypothetical protein